MLSSRHCLQKFMLVLPMLLLAVQCNPPPTPSLPATPGGPSLRIALLSPISGEMATFGRMTRNGSVMVFDEWNKRGGVLGHHIDWAIYDTPCEFGPAREATQQAIADGRTFIIGPTCSEAAIGAATVAETEQVLMISATATHPLVTVDGQGKTRPSVFRAGYVWPWQARVAAQFALNNLQTTQAAILTTPNDDYGAMLADAFTQTFTAQGGKIVWHDTYTPGDSGLTGKLTAIAQAGAAVIYLPVDAATANQVGSQLNALGLKNITLIGSDSWDAAGLDRTATNGSYFTTHFTIDNPDVGEWANAYKSDFAIEPNTLAALGYDAASLLVNAIEQANSLDPTTVAEILKTGEYTGVTGPIRFDKQHNPIKPVPLVQINQGEIRFVTSIIP
jgi:branched-chain amino acid transport system substrate-binding protein